MNNSIQRAQISDKAAPYPYTAWIRYLESQHVDPEHFKKFN